MEEKIKQLCCLLASYEMDEPHIPIPGLFDEENLYPEFDWEKFEKNFLKTEHCGDCMGLPAPCNRCFGENILHKAKWIVERMNWD
jgi:hypothetical protein